MIIVRLLGGLGNQMFQYAMGRALSARLGCELALDIQDLKPGQTHRGYELEQVFGVHANIASAESIQSVIGWRTTLRRLLLRRSLSFLRRGRLVVEPGFGYWNGVRAVSDPCYLAGYWQSERYFSDCVDGIRKDFTFAHHLSDANLELAKEIHSTVAVGVHVRRGDYVSNRRINALHGVCDIDYYQRALARISTQVASPRYFVFSDDLGWAKENLQLPSDTRFVEGNHRADAHVDMRLMSMCRHQIIANSTFSWWSAWLNANPNRVVIAPRAWFRRYVEGTETLFPADWGTC